MLRLLFLLVIASISSTSAYAYEAGITTNMPHTLIDQKKRISFAFDGRYALKVGKMVNIPEGTPLNQIPADNRCTPANEGVIRFNTGTKSIEFCNGISTDQSWQSTAQKEADVLIDYSQCQYSAKTGTSGLNKFGVTNALNMDASCNKIDHVMVATDIGSKNDPYDKFYCCKIKLVYK